MSAYSLAPGGLRRPVAAGAALLWPLVEDSVGKKSLKTSRFPVDSIGFSCFFITFHDFFVDVHRKSEALELFSSLPLLRVSPDAGSFNALAAACPWLHILSLLEQMDRRHVAAEAPSADRRRPRPSVALGSRRHGRRGALHEGGAALAAARHGGLAAGLRGLLEAQRS